MTARQEAKFTFTDSNTVSWSDSTLADGVTVKNLGKANGRAMQLVRFEPGAVDDGVTVRSNVADGISMADGTR